MITNIVLQAHKKFPEKLCTAIYFLDDGTVVAEWLNNKKLVTVKCNPELLMSCQSNKNRLGRTVKCETRNLEELASFFFDVLENVNHRLEYV